MVSFQHDGTGTIKYSFLGSTLPGYVRLIDVNGDDIPDQADVLNLGLGDDFVAVNLLEDGSVPNLGFTVGQQAGIINAINAWNEVANFNLEPGGSSAFSSGSGGTSVDGGGALVGNLGGEAGFGETLVSRNDDGSQSVDISAVFENGLNFFGGTHSNIFVNTNGSISFNDGIGTFTPETITGGTTPIIAPFWADIDTRVDSDAETPDSGPIYVDLDTEEDIVTITWANVGYYSRNADLTNAFQLQLYDRGLGDFDIVFRYSDINWTTGDASDGEGGLGGTPARMGYSAGNSTDFFELSASGNQGAVLSLETAPGNTGVAGLWEFEVRSGGVLGDIVFGQSDLLLDGEYDRAFHDFDGVPYSVAGFSGTVSDDPEIFGVDGDVYFQTPEGEGFSFFPGDQDFTGALRAVGLALGFADLPQNSSSVLQPDEAEPFYISPTPADIETAQAIYGPNWLTRADDTIYFGPGGHFELDSTGRLIENGTRALATVWDGGGEDLIDLTHNTSGVWGGFGTGNALYAVQDGGGVISFSLFARAAYSSPEVEDLGLAPSNAIENARLGSGGDTVSGGAWANVIEGGLGDDTLAGLDGDDELHGGYMIANRGEGAVADGDDQLHGGNGNDTAIFDNPNSYTLILTSETIRMQDRSENGTGTDVLEDIEILSFEDDRFEVFADDTFNLARFDGVMRIGQDDLKEIVELYIAYFNRAPDAMGLLFWADAFADDGLTLEQVAAGFVDQDETRALYPEGTGNTAFVNAVYQNVLGRQADAGGSDFWRGELDSGGVGRETFILEILRGAKAEAPPGASQEFIDLQSIDQQYLLAKADIGAYFSIHKGMSNVSNANEVMQLFNREQLNQLPAVSAIDEFAAVSEDDTFGDFLIQVQGILDNPFA